MRARQPSTSTGTRVIAPRRSRSITGKRARQRLQTTQPSSHPPTSPRKSPRPPPFFLCFIDLCAPRAHVTPPPISHPTSTSPRYHPQASSEDAPRNCSHRAKRGCRRRRQLRIGQQERQQRGCEQPRQRITTMTTPRPSSPPPAGMGTSTRTTRRRITTTKTPRPHRLSQAHSSQRGAQQRRRRCQPRRKAFPRALSST